MENQEQMKKIKPSKKFFSRFFMSGFYKKRPFETKGGNRKLITFCALIALVLGLWLYNSHNNHKGKQKIPVPVQISKVRIDEVPIYINTIGTVTPVESTVIKTQIQGRITAIYFQEGQRVQKGDVLVQIDPKPYEATLQQAQGQLIRDQALLENAQLDLKRYKQLYGQDSVSQQTLDTQINLVKQYEGTVQSDQGIVDSAACNLNYCKIISDIDGVIGLRQINAGNFVQPSDTTPITTVNAISPISVVFPIPQDSLSQVQESFQKGPVVTEAFDRGHDKVLDTGNLLAIDSQIDNTTGTIKLKATFKNEQSHLFPNQFVTVRLKIETLANALMIPTAAIQMGRQGPFVYIVNEESKTVYSKPVVVKAALAEDSAIAGDVEEGQVIVVQGQDKLTDGTAVLISAGENHPSQTPLKRSSP
jgi:multidrug efflux system membrane fusion protein